MGLLQWIARAGRYVAVLVLFCSLPFAYAAESPREQALQEIISGKSGSTSERFGALTQLAELYRSQGFKRRALPLLEEAETLSRGLHETHQRRVRFLLGSLLYDMGAYAEAQDALESLMQETAGEDSLERVQILNELGMVFGLVANHRRAVELFDESVALAFGLGARTMQARINVNLMKSVLTMGNVERLSEASVRLESLLTEIPNDIEKAEILIAVANEYRRAFWYFNLNKQWMLNAHNHLQDAGRIARQNGDLRLLSYARGYLGRLYEDDKALDTALSLSREAAFHANSIQAYESAYLWEWQIGRIQKKLGNTTKSVESYEQAIATLEHVRQDLIDGSPYTFHQKIQPLFSELSDTLLTSARALPEGGAKQGRLAQVQEILEQAKSAELQDYFQNECVLPETSVELGQVESGTATVYPVILPDRLEILVSIDGKIHQFVSRIDVVEFNSLVNEFRDNLQIDYGDDDYLLIGQDLYQLVIEPFEELLVEQDVSTLLFVPEGVLRTVPISALHDGDQYLIEKYAIATTPGLKLTLPTPLELSESAVFAGGISESLRGFSGLPGVPIELQNLQSKYGASVLRDSAFSTDVVQEQMSSDAYSIVHIATHGHFDSNPQKSFLLTYDDKLTMNMLERSIGYRKYLGDPLELLVLSACETAAGDNRAALGLAGVALKAGARSAVATLWQISDAATVRLIDAFYENSAAGRSTKAVALQQAQVTLIDDDMFSHPSDWAPFLLIGNWL